MSYTRPGTYGSASTAPQIPSTTNQGGIACFVGTAPMGSDQPGAVFWDLASFQAQYGDAAASPGYTGPLAAYLFFLQSGPGGLAKGLMFKRVGAAHATLSLAGTGLSLTLTASAAYAGTAGNGVSVVVAAESGGTQSITITDANDVIDGGGAYVVTVNSTTATNLMTLINQKSSMFTASAPTDANVPFATGAFTPTGGTTGQGAAIAQADVQTADSFLPNFVVTLDGSMTTAGYLQTDVTAESGNYAKPRVGVTGPALGTNVATIESNLTTLATSTGRMVYLAHDGLRITSPATGLPTVIDGFYGAAILCGIKCSSDPAEPATNKPIAGIIGVGTALPPATEDTLAGAGGTVFTGGYAATGGAALVVLDSVTTTLASVSPTWNKLVNVTAVDEVVNRLTKWNQINAIGKRGGSKTGQMIIAGWTGVLSRAVKDDIIDAFSPVVPSQNGATWSVPLGLTANGETDIVNIPLTVS